MAVSDALARANAHLEAAKADPIELETLRRRGLLALLRARDVEVPDADRLDSTALQQFLDRARARGNGHP